MRKTSRLLAAALLLAQGAPAMATVNPGASAEPLLLVPMGTRAFGMGGAFTGVASDASALYYNPGGLARLTAHELAVSYITGISDNNLQQYAYGGPLPFSGISGNGYASVGTSLLVAQGGNIQINTLNPDGTLGGTSNVSASNDLIYSLGYAERVGSTPVETKDGGSYGINHFLGVSGKLVHSTLVQAYTANTASADVGYLMQSPETGLSMGLSGLNLGGSLRYSQVADPFPTMLRAGFAWQGAVQSDQVFTLATDGVYDVRGRQWHADLGGEYFIMKTFGFRLGYQFLQDVVGFTAGFGYRWKSRIMIDYAFGYSQGVNDSHRFTVTWRFGGVNPAVRGKNRKPFMEEAPEREAEPVESMDQKRPTSEPAPSPRSTPHEAPTQGVPGWIY